ncbi:hypothetical protein LXL04_027187 [Taraxacum kok-saghyz]
MAQIQVQPPTVSGPNGVASAATATANASGVVAAAAVAGAAVAVAGANQAFVTTSLYVGDLEFNVTDSQLYDLFNQVGQVVSVRVCRDLTTRRSLGYGYVNYSNPPDAARAIDVLNFTAINGKAIRIMYSHRDPSIRKSGTANIFIKNLDKSIDNKVLHDTFSTFGNILSCKIAVDITGQSKGYGFVQFDTEEAAQTAIDKLNGMLINDKQVYVGHFLRKQERDSSLSRTKFNNVYVKNLSETTTDEDLKQTFGEYGIITSAVVMRDGDGKSKCFGFVNFEDAYDAANAVEVLNGKKFDEKEWYVGKAQKKSEREMELKSRFEQNAKEAVDKFQGVNLYVKNLDDTIDDDKLKELFSEYGTITSCKVCIQFLRFLLDACRDTTLIILMVAAVASLALGIKTEGIKEGWYDGGSIALAVIIVIVVTAISDYKQSLQFQNLNEEKQNIHLEVVRGGRRIEISIFDIVVGDVIPLKIGDQVPADGVLISGHSLSIDESSMTGESKIVHKDHKNPFLMSGCKVVDGYGTMLATSVGIHTEWGLLMASISEDNGEETPLQVRLNGVATFIGIVGLVVAVSVLVILLVRFFTGHTEDDEGRIEFIAGKTSVGDAIDGAIKIFTVAGLVHKLNKQEERMCKVRDLSSSMFFLQRLF